jgi:hypothetical protein
MTRRRRILMWTLIPVGTLALIGVLVHVVILPWIVRDRFETLLADAGLKGATFRVPTATLWSARILDVKFPDSQSRIDRINVRYGVGGVRRGQLDALRISGMKIALGVDANGKIDLGPLAPLFKPKPQKPATRSTTRHAREPVPIVRIELVESAVIVQTVFEKFELPLIGTAVGAENYRYLIDFETETGIGRDPERVAHAEHRRHAAEPRCGRRGWGEAFADRRRAIAEGECGDWRQAQDPNLVHLGWANRDAGCSAGKPNLRPNRPAKGQTSRSRKVSFK